MPRSILIPGATPYANANLTDIFDGVFTQQLSSGKTLPGTIGTVVSLINALGSVKLALEVVEDVTSIVANLTEIYVNLQKAGLIEGGGDCCDEILAVLTATNPDNSKQGIADVLRRGLLTQTTVGTEQLDRGIAHCQEIIRQGLYWKLPNGDLVPLGESLGRLVYTGVIGQYEP